MTAYNRRGFLKSTGGLGLAAAAGSLGMLTQNRAFASDTSGYKALVCVFLLGGMDHADTVYPHTQDEYDTLRDARSSLFSAYGVGTDPSSSRDFDNLLSLNVQNAAAFDNRSFALPGSLAPLRDHFNAGNAAIVGGVGPLVEPVDRDSFERRSVVLPERLFSHNDQQSLWATLGIEGRNRGWGGLFADFATASAPARNANFAAISAAGTSPFLAADIARQAVIGPDGPNSLDILSIDFVLRRAFNSSEARALIADHVGAKGVTSQNFYERDLAEMRARGQITNAEFRSFWDFRTPSSVVFPDTPISAQLKTIAETIALNRQLDVPRQVFFAAVGGFDTHSNQSSVLPRLQSELAQGVDAFTRAVSDIGLADDVTLFTASDFGRSVVENGNGTDHGWGGHQFVVGGAVNGGQIYGEMATADPTNDRHTVNGGRLIPSVSVDQYAATLGKWFGLDASELAAAFPALARFDQPDLGFL